MADDGIASLFRTKPGDKNWNGEDGNARKEEEGGLCAFRRERREQAKEEERLGAGSGKKREIWWSPRQAGIKSMPLVVEIRSLDTNAKK